MEDQNPIIHGLALPLDSLIPCLLPGIKAGTRLLPSLAVRLQTILTLLPVGPSPCLAGMLPNTMSMLYPPMQRTSGFNFAHNCAMSLMGGLAPTVVTVSCFVCMCLHVFARCVFVCTCQYACFCALGLWGYVQMCIAGRWHGVRGLCCRHGCLHSRWRDMSAHIANWTAVLIQVACAASRASLLHCNSVTPPCLPFLPQIHCHMQFLHAFP